jgi:hypothetical protein
VILDAYPGPRRCCASGFLDKILGDVAADMGALPAGATVAHLALYLARHLGCDPVILTGQDLGFTDGLYYAPGTAIDAVWAPELNPFNTIEMMQWQRIVRHRTHLHKMTDQRGRSIYTDAQMLTYLQQFERDFSAFRDEGLTIIDATEGGVAKQHVQTASLDDALARHAGGALPALPLPPREPDDDRRRAARRRVDALREEMEALRDVSRRTHRLLETMLAEQGDPRRMKRHFERLDRYRDEVSERFAAFELLNQVNQLGVFKRQRADRRLHLQTALDPLARQRGQLERDRVNVAWLADAADELIAQLRDAARVLDGHCVMPRSATTAEDDVRPAGPAARVAALVPIDPGRGAPGASRPLDASWRGASVLQATLERLGRCRRLDSIVLLAPRDLDVESLLDRSRIGLAVHVEPTEGSPFDGGREAVAAARAWASTSWRGGIAGMSVYDEVLCARPMATAMERLGLGAGLLVGPDWPLVDPAACDLVIERHLEHPEQHRLVFTQAPPGLCGCLVSAALMSELTDGNRLCTIGAMLVYQPRTPQADPVAKAANVQIAHAARSRMVRAVADEAEALRRLDIAAPPDEAPGLAETATALAIAAESAPPPRPSHLILELTTRRERHGRFHASRRTARDGDLPAGIAARLLTGLGTAGDVALTLDGAGDPLLHPDIERIVAAARSAGIRHVHLRTELRADPDLIRRVVDAGVAVVSVDLHADRAATYREMMGDDGFRAVLERLDVLLEMRGRDGAAGLALPWIVPRLQRCAATADDLETFFDRWQHQIGAAVIEGPPPGAEPDGAPLLEARTPDAAAWHALTTRLTVLSDGSVPVSEIDREGRDVVGSVTTEPVAALWPRLLDARRELRDREGTGAADLRLWSP